jgi:hypothetical protein
LTASAYAVLYVFVREGWATLAPWAVFAPPAEAQFRPFLTKGQVLFPVTHRIFWGMASSPLQIMSDLKSGVTPSFWVSGALRIAPR